MATLRRRLYRVPTVRKTEKRLDEIFGIRYSYVFDVNQAFARRRSFSVLVNTQDFSTESNLRDDDQLFLQSCQAYLKRDDEKDPKIPFWLRNSQDSNRNLYLRFNSVNNMLKSYLGRDKPHLETALVIAEFLLGPGRRLSHIAALPLVEMLKDKIEHGKLSPPEKSCYSNSAFSIFNSIKDRSPAITDIVVNILCSNNSLDRAQLCIMHLLDSGISPDTKTFLTLLRSYEVQGDKENISKVICEMYRGDILMEEEVVKFLVDHANEKNVNYIWDLYKKNSRLPSPSYLSEKSLSDLISVFCHVGSVDSACRVLQDMKDLGYAPQKFIYSAIIRKYCILKNPKHAYSIFLDMKAAGYLPDFRTYSGVIFALSKGGEASTAELVLDEMMGKKDIQSVRLCTALMKSYLLDNQLEQAERIFHRMQSMHVELDGIAYLVAMNLSFSLKSEGKALALCEEMRSKGIPLTRDIYHALIYGLFNLGKVQEACQAFADMQSEGIPADASSYTILLNLFGKKGDVDRVHSLYKEAVEREIEPTFPMFTALMGFFKNGDVVREMMGEETYSKFIKFCRERYVSYPVVVDENDLAIDIRGHTKEIAVSVFIDYLNQVQLKQPETYKDLLVITGKTGRAGEGIVDFLKHNKIEHTLVSDEGYILIPSDALAEYADIGRSVERQTYFLKLLALRYGTATSLILAAFVAAPMFLPFSFS